MPKYYTIVYFVLEACKEKSHCSESLCVACVSERKFEGLSLQILFYSRGDLKPFPELLYITYAEHFCAISGRQSPKGRA